MADPTHLPLKVVPTLERDFYRPEGRGGAKKVFGTVNAELRELLAGQVAQVHSHFIESFARYPNLPAVASVQIKQDAIAKSHRPESLFSHQTCPIIGAEGLGRLLVRVTPRGLGELTRKIETATTKQIIASLSTVVSINAFVPLVEIDGVGTIKVKLFRHQDTKIDDEVDDAFRQILQELEIRESNEIHYGDGLKIFQIPSGNSRIVEQLTHYVGTQSIGTFPIYQPVRTSAIKIRAAVEQDFPPPDKSLVYPTIGIIDSGTAVNDQYLSPWRTAREVYVPELEQDTSHGSFVAGLAVHGRAMNHGDTRFPSCSSKFVDVVALSKTGTSEDKLLSVLEDVIPKYP